MTTIKEKLFFNYDGIWSSDFGLLHVSTDSGMFEESISASRSIIETKVRGKDKPHFSGLDYSPLEFELAIAFEHQFDDRKLLRVIDWLMQDYYKPLFFEGKENKVYYCMVVDEPKITHTGYGQGFIVCNMRCNSPFVYSPVIMSEYLDLSTTAVGEIDIYNEGYGLLYPEISIEKVGAGNVVIKNVSNGGEEFELTDLTDREDLYINTEKHIIKSDAESVGVYRYNNASGEFPYMTEGFNRFLIEGYCIVQFRYQFKYRF